MLCSYCATINTCRRLHVFFVNSNESQEMCRTYFVFAHGHTEKHYLCARGKIEHRGDASRARLFKSADAALSAMNELLKKANYGAPEYQYTACVEEV